MFMIFWVLWFKKSFLSNFLEMFLYYPVLKTEQQKALYKYHIVIFGLLLK